MFLDHGMTQYFMRVLAETLKLVSQLDHRCLAVPGPDGVQCSAMGVLNVKDCLEEFKLNGVP